MKTCSKCQGTKAPSEFYANRPECKACTKARTRRHRQENPERKKDAALRYMFGISLERYNEMLEDQRGVCAICSQPESNGRSLAVDHDHGCCAGKKSCGKCVRALLCGDCNMGLGKFRDNPKLLQAAIDYLG